MSNWLDSDSSVGDTVSGESQEGLADGMDDIVWGTHMLQLYMVRTSDQSRYHLDEPEIEGPMTSRDIQNRFRRMIDQGVEELVDPAYETPSCLRATCEYSIFDPEQGPKGRTMRHHYDGERADPLLKPVLEYLQTLDIEVLPQAREVVRLT